jgi:hypothetical protein
MLKQPLCSLQLLIAALAAIVAVSASAQTGGNARPDLSGIWQAVNTANWELEAHGAEAGPPTLGALLAVPPGVSVVVGGEIPYLPAALEKRNANRKDWVKLDPEVKCYMPGIPRATYMPYPFQIVQAADNILFTYEFASASRIVRFNPELKSPAPAWMGWSIGRWDGETLVIEVTDHMPETWFDRAGNHHGEALKVTERYTAIDANTLHYEATIEDPGTFAKPWKISMPLYRRQERNVELLEYQCNTYLLEQEWNNPASTLFEK